MTSGLHLAHTYVFTTDPYVPVRHLLGHLKMVRPRSLLVNLRAYNSCTFRSLHFLIHRCKWLLGQEFPGEGWEDLPDGNRDEDRQYTGMYDILSGKDELEVSLLLEELERADEVRRLSRPKRNKPEERSTEQQPENKKANISIELIDFDSPPIRQHPQGTANEGALPSAEEWEGDLSIPRVAPTSHGEPKQPQSPIVIDLTDN